MARRLAWRVGAARTSAPRCAAPRASPLPGTLCAAAALHASLLPGARAPEPFAGPPTRAQVCKAKFSDGTFYFKFATVACWKTLS